MYESMRSSSGEAHVAAHMLIVDLLLAWLPKNHHRKSECIGMT